MRLTLATDYAIRSILYLCLVGRMTKASEVSEQVNIPKQYLTTMARRLKDAGILDAQPGQAGGYYLMRAPEDISLLDIVRVTEDTMDFSRCLERERYGNHLTEADSPVLAFYAELQGVVENLMGSVTMADLMEKLELKSMGA